MIDHVDHIVLTTRDKDACIRFYVDALGMKLEKFSTPNEERLALKFGSQKINLHEWGKEFVPRAHVAVPGSLKAWCETLQRFGTMNLADVMQPAIKHASRGYAATPYLHECIADSASEMLKDRPISAIYLPKGEPLKAGERPPRPLLLFIAEQIDALPESIEDYLAAERNRQRHVAELQDRLGFRPFGTRPAADLAGWLLPHAIDRATDAAPAGHRIESERPRPARSTGREG